MSIYYRVRGLSGKPASNVPLRIKRLDKRTTATSDANAVVVLGDEYPDDGLTVSEDAYTLTAIPKPIEFPKPSGTGKYGNAYDGLPGQCAEGYTENVHWDPAKRGAFVQCIWDPKPQPTADWAAGVQKSLSEFGEGLSKAIGSVKNAVDGLQKDFAGFKASMYDWLVSRVLEAILQALDNGVKKYGR